MFVLLDMKAKLIVVAVFVWAVCHVIDAQLPNPVAIQVRKTKHISLESASYFLSVWFNKIYFSFYL